MYLNFYTLIERELYDMPNGSTRWTTRSKHYLHKSLAEKAAESLKEGCLSGTTFVEVHFGYDAIDKNGRVVLEVRTSYEMLMTLEG